MKLEMKEDIIENTIKEFIKELDVKENYLEPIVKGKNDNYKYKIYNEISLQHELGIFLEEKLKGYRVFFEKNMHKDEIKNHGGDTWVKAEADIVIVNENLSEKYAIELKFSKGENAATPEHMYNFIKDIHFMEQVEAYCGFTNVYNFILVNSKKYYDVSLNNNSKKDYKRYNIYKIFRTPNRKVSIDKKLKNELIIKKDEMKNLNYYYCKPTGQKIGKKFKLNYKYETEWKILNENNSKTNAYGYLLISKNNRVQQ